MISHLSQVTEYPLVWPEAKGRCAKRQAAKFGDHSVPATTRQIEYEMARWKVRHFTISQDPLYRRQQGDPGVSLWWEVTRPEGVEIRVLACDTFVRREDNLYAILVTLGDLRRIERYGTYTTDQASEGMKALPPPASATPSVKPWWEILGVEKTWPLAAVEMAYRTKAAKAHPDAGGSADEMAAVNAAIEAARKELGT